jgi:NAD(P)H dehydrogenase (quinone)
MNVSVILAHPDPHSLNHAIADAVRTQLESDDHTVAFHDLYKEGFDAALPASEIPREAVLPDLIRSHCTEIRSADGIVVVHPNWWGQPPAILKGWIDRVIRPGVAYEFLEGDSGDGIPRGLLRASTAIVLNTSNTRVDRELTVFGDPLGMIWRNCVFGLCGVSNFIRRTFGIVVTSTDAERKRWIQESRKLVSDHFPMGPPPSSKAAAR